MLHGRTDADNAIVLKDFAFQLIACAINRVLRWTVDIPDPGLGNDRTPLNDIISHQCFATEQGIAEPWGFDLIHVWA